MLNPKISIITINLNNHNGLKKSIQRVIDQSYDNREFIIIDGGSKDDSVNLMKEYDDKISFWISEPDEGIYHAMNKGIKKASGEYCLFLNSGDYLISNTILEEVAGSLDGEEIIYGGGIFSDKKGGSRVVNIPEKLSLDFFYQNSLFHPSTFIKRELFNKYGLYNESYKIVSDWEFFIKTIIVNDAKTKFLPFIISIAEDGGISSDRGNVFLIRKECDLVLKKYFPPAVIRLLADFKKTEAELKWIRKRPLVSIYFKLRKIKKQLSDRKLKSLFTEVYKNKFWGGENSVSGPGSDEKPTALIQKGISEIIEKKNIKSIADAPCGDFIWMKNVIETCYDKIESFMGFDIVDELIAGNNEKYGTSKVKFKIKDLTVSEIPEYDLIICRDCFIHLSFKNILRILKNFKQSKSKYLLVSTYNDSSRRNFDMGDYRINFRALNMQKFPFSFDSPELIINEDCKEFDGKYSDKSLALWELNQIDLVKTSIYINLWNCRFILFRIKQIIKESIYNFKKL